MVTVGVVTIVEYNGEHDSKHHHGTSANNMSMLYCHGNGYHGTSANNMSCCCHLISCSYCVSDACCHGNNADSFCTTTVPP